MHFYFLLLFLLVRSQCISSLTSCCAVFFTWPYKPMLLESSLDGSSQSCNLTCMVGVQQNNLIVIGRKTAKASDLFLCNSAMMEAATPLCRTRLSLFCNSVPHEGSFFYVHDVDQFYAFSCGWDIENMGTWLVYTNSIFINSWNLSRSWCQELSSPPR